jgi:hypothetical protein
MATDRVVESGSSAGTKSASFTGEAACVAEAIAGESGDVA